MTDIEGQIIPPTEPKAKSKRKSVPWPASENQVRAAGIRSEQLKTTGKPIPACPMTPEELMDTWNIGQSDAMGITIKILRQQIGSEALELMDSIPLVEFDARKIAADFGKGRYLLRPAAGSYAKCSAVLPISENLARACGWGRLPATAQDMTAERVVRNAAEGPTDPLDLMAAMERLIDRKMAELGRAPGLVAQAPFDPMSAMQAQMSQMTAWMGFMDRMEAQMQARVERRMGVDPEPAANSHTSLLETLIPIGLKILDRMTSGPATAPQRTAVAPSQPQLHQQAHAEQSENIIPFDRRPTPTAPGGPEMPTLPDMTLDERKAVALSVKMLQPFASQLVELGNSPATDDQIVAELEGYIPGHMEEPLITLASIIGKHGPQILQVIHPGLAVPRWAAILTKLAQALQS